MIQHLMNFSGGVCSFWASKRLVDRHGAAQVTNLFADTLIEDPDLYRFNRETAEYLGVPLTRICEGRTPWQVFRDQHLIGNTHADICSRLLKREFLWSWINGSRFTFGPGRTIIHLGMDFTEYSRLDGVRQNNPDWQIEAPMCEEPIWDKQRMLKELVKIGITPPRLYAFGFPHNNCGGFCVKAGISHFVHLLKVLPAVYALHEQEERFTRQFFKDRGVSNWDFAILRDRRSGKTIPLTLETLRQRVEAGEEFPKLEWGGCGCAVSYDKPLPEGKG